LRAYRPAILGTGTHKELLPGVAASWPSKRALLLSAMYKLKVRDDQTAGNGQEALAMLESLISHPRVLIVDPGMPRRDGLKLLEHLRERGGVPPIILVSSC
jgi:CheY-like chemotaxis protein